MARRMIDMVQEWVGHWTGGLLVAEVVAMYIFSGLSGSKAADIATVGGVMKTPLRDYGDPPTESVAGLAAHAAMGETIPPSLMLLVLASVTTLSVGSLFLAGMLPAAVLALVFIAVVIVRSHMHGYFMTAISPGACVGSDAMIGFSGSVIVVGGIVGGVLRRLVCHLCGGLWVCYRLLFIARLDCAPLGWYATALTAGMVLFMVAASNLVSQAIVIDGLGRTLGKAFGTLQPDCVPLVTVV